MWDKLFKRIVDLLIASTALVILLPIMMIVAASIRIQMGSPVLFKQLRPGWYGRPFTLYKFRTMKDSVDSSGTPLSDEERLTDIGGFLRKYSLDELPQLLNVLRGELSLVGPRPLLMQYLHRYTPEQARRHEVKPGITGWAQVNGRNALSWDEKFALDVWYVDHQSFLLDCKILWLTVIKVIRSEGINHQGSATMTEFKGYEQNQTISE